MSCGVPLKGKKRIPENIKEEVRKRVIETGSRIDVAKEFGIPYITVCKIAKGLPGKKGNPGIRGYTLKILQSTDKRGYFIPDKKDNPKSTSSYRTLKKYLPNTIKKIESGGSKIIYDEKRKIEACRAFMGRRRNRIISWHKYRTIMSLFGICKPPKEAREELGKMGFVDYPHSKRPKFKKQKEEGETPQNLNDFGKFLLSELLKNFYCVVLN